jgi:hypothetical protein
MPLVMDALEGGGHRLLEGPQRLAGRQGKPHIGRLPQG